MSLLDRVHPEWLEIFETKIELFESIEKKIAGSSYNPRHDLVMKAFEFPLTEIKVVIFGQDPYPNPEYAMGLAFSVPEEAKSLPASLANIFRELQSDIGGELRKNGDLTSWSNQGVALINRVLTVPPGTPGGHVNFGWQEITNLVAKTLGRQGAIPILWGNYAKELGGYFYPPRIISSVHPSPLSANRGFFGSKPFSRANQFLAQKPTQEIDWLRLN